MTPFVVGFVGIFILIVLLAMGMPVAFATGLVGFVGMWYVSGFEAGLGILKLIPYSGSTSYTLALIPLFILMGQIAFNTGVSQELFRCMYTIFGRLRGGLAIASVAGCAGFAAICGSSAATAATMGTISLPEMKRYRYSQPLAYGSIAAGGTLGPLIPPSIGLAVYGILTEQSIGRLFLAGLFPGIINAVLFIILISVWVRMRPEAGPAGPATSLREKLASILGIWTVAILFVLVIGGLYVGIFTASEAAGVGAFSMFVLTLARKKLTWKRFIDSLFDTARTGSMVLVILVMTYMFGHFLVVTRLSISLANWIAALNTQPILVLAAIYIIYIVLGCFMEMLAVSMIMIPILFPIALAMGIDPIWFGIFLALSGEAGLVTPPVGLNIFVLAGLFPETPIGDIYRGALPFVIAMFFGVVLIVAFPVIATWLPSTMIGS